MSISIRDFDKAGGLANQPSSHLVVGFTDLRNMKQFLGGLVSRCGTRWMGTSSQAKPISKIKFGYDEANARVNRIIACGTKIQFHSGTTLTDVTGLSAKTASAAVNEQIEFYKNIFWRTNGVNAQTQVSNGATPAESAWTLTGLPGGWIPKVLCMHKDRMYALRDDDLYFSAFGNPESWDTSEAYKLPGDKSGRYVRAMVSMGDWICCTAGDYMLSIRGNGIFNHRISHLPKGPAVIAPKSLVNYNGRAVFMTNVGPCMWDGSPNPVRKLDVENQVNWGDMNFKDTSQMSAVRVEDEVYFFFRTKGPARVATSLVAASPRSFMASIYAVMSNLSWSISRAIISAPTYVSHYYVLNMETGKVSGPHDGAFASAEWADWNNGADGDAQELWAGSGKDDGKLYKINQSDLFVDEYGDSSVYSGIGTPYPVEFTTGSVHGIAPNESPMDSVSVDLVRLLASTCPSVGGVLEVSLIFNEDRDRQISIGKINMNQKGPRGGHRARPEEKDFDRGRVLQHDIILNKDRTTQHFGLLPQVMFKGTLGQELHIRSLEVVTSAGKG